MKPTQFAAAGLALALSGCVGGSGDEGAPSDEIAEAGRRLGGLAEPGFTADEFAAGMETVAERANTLVLSDLVYFTEIAGLPASFRLSSNCTGDRCVQIEPFFDDTFEVSIEDIRTGDGVIDTLNPNPVGELHGVRTAHVRAFDRLQSGDSISLRGYGAWIEHGTFLVTVGAVEGGDFMGATIVSSMSFGDSPNTIPDFAASWNGIVAGVDTSETDTAGNFVQGKARIDLGTRLGETIVDVAFSGLHDLETGEGRDPLRWEDIVVTADGFTDGASIDGRFYGPDHEEAGGVFERGDLLGAFGATKEEQAQ
ncbi:MAG: hypothetical protein OXC01_02035 [Immundisolibacterales bacterium]|nr:hypothetical protein [Immundisolibacterales bacterium]